MSKTHRRVLEVLRREEKQGRGNRKVSDPSVRQIESRARAIHEASRQSGVLKYRNMGVMGTVLGWSQIRDIYPKGYSSLRSSLEGVYRYSSEVTRGYLGGLEDPIGVMGYRELSKVFVDAIGLIRHRSCGQFNKVYLVRIENRYVGYIQHGSTGITVGVASEIDIGKFYSRVTDGLTNASGVQMTQVIVSRHEVIFFKAPYNHS